MPCASRVGRARRDGAREGRHGCSGRRRPYRPPAGAAAASAAAAGAAARAAGARLARRVLPPGSPLRRPGGSTRSNFASRVRAEAPAARARPAASRRRRNMAYSTALEEEEEAGWQCCMPPRGSFGVLSSSQGAAERVRNRDNPPPQPRPVEAHLGTAMRRRPFKGRARADGGGGLACSNSAHRAPSVRTGAPNEGRPAQGLSRGRSAPSAVSRSRSSGSQNGKPSFPMNSVPQRKRPRSYWNTPTSDLPRASLFEPEIYFLLGPDSCGHPTTLRPRENRD